MEIAGSHRSAADVARNAAGALMNLAAHPAAESKVRIGRAGAIEEVVELMVTHGTDAQVQECACTMISDLVTVTVNADRFTLIFLTQGSGGGYNSFGRFRSLLDRSRFIQVKEHLTDFLIDLQDWHANSQVAFIF